MIKKIRNILLSATMVFSLMAMPVVLFGDVSHAGNRGSACEGVASIGGGNACNSDAPGNQFGNFIERVINILLFIIGAIAVIMIIIGGIRYTTSNGDQGQITGAKNTILYAIVGLVVAIMAYAIVNFVLTAL